ncbi:unnamed protein product [Prorocentrum cordatum]|uniref:RNA helicase n=1 Tax=Prorocentrum cordatum TaxID=2364126 RepID=A0ABN9QP94_9DINO|nr:unnamed protein product [Polarella glacialis]
MTSATTASTASSRVETGAGLARPPAPGFDRPASAWTLESARRGLEAGLGLPMASLCGQLRDLVELHRVIVIDAATGSGKSTLVPICLAEQCAELGRDCRIVVTQPRKLAAKGLAKRVSQQCGTQVGNFVGYRVGGNREDKGCKVVYVTAGHMLEALVHNPQHLQTFSHLVLDEVHERFVEADFLMSLLRLWLSHPRTANTRLVVMSATLQKTLSEFFRPLLLPAPAAASPGKLTLPGSSPFEVSEYFWDDIPREWPNVDLKSIGFGSFTNKHKQLASRERASQLGNLCKQLASVAARLLCELRVGGSSVALVFLPGLEQIRDMELEVEKQVNHRGWAQNPPRVFTMHSALDSEIYEGALDPIQPGEWRIVLATNIAESSLTIPDVSAVVDFGCHRVSVYDDDARMSRLTMEWCSRASMKQRRGRTGRTCPGQYIRLLPKAVYDGLSDYDESGVERSSLQRVTLEAAHLAQVLSAPPELLAGMPVDVAGVGRGEASYWDPSQDGWHVAFGTELEDHSQGYPEGRLTPREVDVRHMLCLLPTPPKESRVESALKELYELGALVASNVPSALGAACLKLPTDVCLGRLMVLGWSLNVAADAVVLAAALSLIPAVDVFRTPFNTKAELDHTELRTLQFAVEQRRIFDRGSYSEPLTIHALCMDWLREGYCSLGRAPATTWGRHINTKVWAQLTEKVVEFSEAMLRIMPTTSSACDPLRRLVQRARGGREFKPPPPTPTWMLSALLTWSLAPLGFVAVGQTPAFYGGGTYGKFSKVVKNKNGVMDLALWWPSINEEKAKKVVQAACGTTAVWAWEPKGEIGADAEGRREESCFTGIKTREQFELLSRICGPFNGKQTDVGTLGSRVKTRPPRHPCSLLWLMPRRDGQDMTEVRVNWKSQAETLLHVPKRGERNAYVTGLLPQGLQQWPSTLAAKSQEDCARALGVPADSRPKKFLVAAGGEYRYMVPGDPPTALAGRAAPCPAAAATSRGRLPEPPSGNQATKAGLATSGGVTAEIGPPQRTVRRQFESSFFARARMLQLLATAAASPARAAAPADGQPLDRQVRPRTGGEAAFDAVDLTGPSGEGGPEQRRQRERRPRRAQQQPPPPSDPAQAALAQYIIEWGMGSRIDAIQTSVSGLEATASASSRRAATLQADTRAQAARLSALESSRPPSSAASSVSAVPAQVSEPASRGSRARGETACGVATPGRKAPRAEPNEMKNVDSDWDRGQVVFRQHATERPIWILQKPKQTKELDIRSDPMAAAPLAQELAELKLPERLAAWQLEGAHIFNQAVCAVPRARHFPSSVGFSEGALANAMGTVTDGSALITANAGELSAVEGAPPGTLGQREMTEPIIPDGRLAQLITDSTRGLLKETPQPKGHAELASMVVHMRRRARCAETAREDSGDILAGPLGPPLATAVTPFGADGGDPELLYLKRLEQLRTWETDLRRAERPHRAGKPVFELRTEEGHRAITTKARGELTRAFYAELFRDSTIDVSLPEWAHRH